MSAPCQLPDWRLSERPHLTFVLWRGDIGGAERVTVDLAAALLAIGIEADIAFVDDQGLLAPQLEARRIQAACLRLGRGRRVLVHPRALPGLLQSLGTNIAVLPSVGYLAASLRLGGFRGRIVGVEHGGLFRLLEAPRARRLSLTLDRWLGASCSDVEVAVSRYMESLASGVPHSPVRQICHGVEAPTELTPLPGTPALSVGFVGRHHPGKGVNVLLDALAWIRSQDTDVTVTARIAGDGPMRPVWETQARTLGLEDSVTFTGWIDELSSHWAACHVAVAPNDAFRESFCMSMLEAMAHGRPTVVTRLGALPELVQHGATGAIVEPGAPEALARALLAYASEPFLITDHGAAARARALDRYSVTRMANEYLALATDLMARPH
jgi:glycosyltransferase involved in cell wall biosynthesis